MADGRNRVLVELQVDGEGNVTAALRGAGDEAERLTRRTNEVGAAGLGLRDVFAGSVLADFFVRGTQAAITFTAESVRAAAVASDANRQLEFSAAQAGLSYTKASELAEGFGRRVGASNTEAARTFADIVRLAERAGRLADVDKLGRGFADLAAARGIKGAELSSLIGTILSGQDEGLNRLGADDPGKLNAAYAASIGKKAENLNQQEKAAAAVLAVEKLMGQAQGESAKRLDDTAGKLDSVASGYENVKTAIGVAITESAQFRDVLDSILGLLSQMPGAGRKGFRDVAEAGREAKDSLSNGDLLGGLKSFYNRVELGATEAFVSLGAIFSGDVFTRQGRDALALAEAYRQDILNRDENTARELQVATNNQLRQRQVAELRRVGLSQNEITTIYQTAYGEYAGEAREKYIADEANRLLEEKGSEKAAASKAANAAEALRLTRRTAYADNTADALKVENLDERIAKLRELKHEASEIFDADEVTKQTKKIDEAIEKTQKEIEAAVRTARDALRSFLNETAAQADRDNPFTSLFIRARDEAEETRKKFLIFGEDFAAQMARVREESIQTEIAAARLHSSLQALRYGQEARRLEGPFVGATGPEERRLAAVNAQLSALTADPELARCQRVLTDPYRQPFMLRLDAERDTQNTLDRLLRLDVSGAGRGGREAQAQAILSLLNQFDPRTVATSASPFFRQLRDAGVGAYQTQRDALRANVEDTLLRERAGNAIQQDARELLKAIRASGLTDRLKVQEFLGVTGSLSDKELVSDLRLARVEALRAGERFKAESEREGEERARRIDGVMQKLDRVLTEKGLRLDGDQAKVQVEVLDRSDLARTSVLGNGW